MTSQRRSSQNTPGYRSGEEIMRVMAVVRYDKLEYISVSGAQVVKGNSIEQDIPDFEPQLLNAEDHKGDIKFVGEGNVVAMLCDGEVKYVKAEIEKNNSFDSTLTDGARFADECRNFGRIPRMYVVPLELGGPTAKWNVLRVPRRSPVPEITNILKCMVQNWLWYVEPEYDPTAVYEVNFGRVSDEFRYSLRLFKRNPRISDSFLRSRLNILTKNLYNFFDDRSYYYY